MRENPTLWKETYPFTTTSVGSRHSCLSDIVHGGLDVQNWFLLNGEQDTEIEPKKGKT